MFNIGDQVRNKYHAASGKVVEIKRARERDLVKLEILDEVSGEKHFEWYDLPDLEKAD